MSIPTNNHDETKPAGGRDINLGDNDIREFKTQVREIIAVDHKMESSGQGADWGKHNTVSLLEQADLGTGEEGKPILGAQTVDDKAELVFTDEDDNDVQITDSGESFGFRSGDLLMSSNTNIPGGFSDVSATYNNKFIRISSGTPLNTGGSDSHNHGGSSGNHTLTISEMPSHDHSYKAHHYSDNWSTDTGISGGHGEYRTRSNEDILNTGGGGSHNHSISSANNIPVYVQVKMYKKD